MVASRPLISDRILGKMKVLANRSHRSTCQVGTRSRVSDGKGGSTLGYAWGADVPCRLERSGQNLERIRNEQVGADVTGVVAMSVDAPIPASTSRIRVRTPLIGQGSATLANLLPNPSLSEQAPGNPNAAAYWVPLFYDANGAVTWAASSQDAGTGSVIANVEGTLSFSDTGGIRMSPAANADGTGEWPAVAVPGHQYRFVYAARSSQPGWRAVPSLGFFGAVDYDPFVETLGDEGSVSDAWSDFMVEVTCPVGADRFQVVAQVYGPAFQNSSSIIEIDNLRLYDLSGAAPEEVEEFNVVGDPGIDSYSVEIVIPVTKAQGT